MSRDKPRIVCVHGFLGRAADWDFLRDAGFDIEAVDLFSRADVSAGSRVWSGRDARSPLALPQGDVLLGYSLGGRLALDALVHGAGFDRAIIVSAGLNLEDERDRQQRRERDQAWARRFEAGDWQTLMRDWNAQPVFGGNARARDERDFDRAALAGALRRWSPGVMPPLAPELPRVDASILWIAGERDVQYVGVARRAASLLPRADLWICPDAGHRVPWEQPGVFVERISRWLKNDSR